VQRRTSDLIIGGAERGKFGSNQVLVVNVADEQVDVCWWRRKRAKKFPSINALLLSNIYSFIFTYNWPENCIF